ncbi:uncharacterized protein TrAFT101_008507 [Trichoderma asperellum]|uniref:uncharacterized protein n=1 Tax=Trichoderma asperellum TaxID=101201 RepID=UPI00332E02B4|nr:hypothetical protein TrAFT101_008507 [Trichoderma asperellum]
MPKQDHCEHAALRRLLTVAFYKQYPRAPLIASCTEQRSGVCYNGVFIRDEEPWSRIFPAIVRTESEIALRKHAHAGARALPSTSEFSVELGDELIVGIHHSPPYSGTCQPRCTDRAFSASTCSHFISTARHLILREN